MGLHCPQMIHQRMTTPNQKKEESANVKYASHSELCSCASYDADRSGFCIEVKIIVLQQHIPIHAFNLYAARIRISTYHKHIILGLAPQMRIDEIEVLGCTEQYAAATDPCVALE